MYPKSRAASTKTLLYRLQYIYNEVKRRWLGAMVAEVRSLLDRTRILLAFHWSESTIRKTNERTEHYRVSSHGLRRKIQFKCTE